MSLKARDIHAHMQSVGSWVDWEHTCDGFKAGDPDVEVKGIAVGWQSLQSALEEAQRKGCNLFITHEPTFYSHMEDDVRIQETVPAQRKHKFLEQSGMVVYRCHDVWDRFPKLGIVDAWSEFLGLGKPIAKADYYNLHRVPATTVWELTMRLAQSVAALGEQAVQLYGKKWQMVHKLAVGTGAITNAQQMVALGADVILTTDDGTTLWRDAAWMADLGLPMILANHMTAEIPGLQKLVEYLKGQFPGVPVEFVGPTCSYEIFAMQRFRDTPIRMRRDDLENLPPIVIPEGYKLRPMRADEAWAYLEVMNRSNYMGECDQAWFENTFTKDPEYDPSYLQLIWKGERPVAAAAAWHNTIDGERWGMIHWVGASYTERGKGLGKLITLAALHKLRARGFAHAELTTGLWRMPAVASYLSLGFRPWPTELAPQEVWDQELRELEEWRHSSRKPKSAPRRTPPQS